MEAPLSSLGVLALVLSALLRVECFRLSSGTPRFAALQLAAEVCARPSRCLPSVSWSSCLMMHEG